MYENITSNWLSPEKIDSYIDLPLNERARFVSEMTRRATASVEQKVHSTEIPDDIRAEGIPAVAQFLLDNRFVGYPTIGTVCHATDGDRSSLLRFEGQVKTVEQMLADRQDMTVDLLSNRDRSNSYYTIFPSVGIVFRERELATTKRDGNSAQLVKRTSAVVAPEMIELLGDISVEPVRRLPRPYHGSRLPDRRIFEGEDRPADEVAINLLATDAIYEKIRSNKICYADELKTILADGFGIEKKDRRLAYFDVYEHANDLFMLQALDMAMIDQPRRDKIDKRKNPLLHVVDSQLYFKDL